MPCCAMPCFAVLYPSRLMPPGAESEEDGEDTTEEEDEYEDHDEFEDEDADGFEDEDEGDGQDDFMFGLPAGKPLTDAQC